ncbi:hypothetical protein GH714_022568 [Hevea brasiliensis]|uniref:Protein kinase domain-containing protein n=1 Tax=Hevea brasiliensis TaxID=3981 RepID=A0A6A6LIN0_HEVBR|nr:hypothetical protein GH714_022568 [Hevea brasiliensis]
MGGPIFLPENDTLGRSWVSDQVFLVKRNVAINISKINSVKYMDGGATPDIAPPTVYGPEIDQSHLSTAVKGTFGYLVPEYFERQQLTEKSYVYSFGIVLFQVLCARPVADPTCPEGMNLVDWVMELKKNGH